jgi:RNA polymerase sigma-70 factor (ECF subfamily)
MADELLAPLPAEADLVAAVASGSEVALATLYDRHAAAIRAVALRLTGDRHIADDVVQEVFLTLWNRAERFDPQIGSLSAWLATVARHRAVDRLRAAGRRPRLVTPPRLEDESPLEALERALRSSPTALGPAADDPVRALDLAEAREAIGAVLANMSDQEREVILLAYRDELSQSEIATHLGWPLGTVKTRTRRALARLRAALADVYGPSVALLPVRDEVDAGSTLPGGEA